MPSSPGSPVDPIPPAPRVYVEPAVVAARTGSGSARVASDAEAALRHLVDAGFEVRLLGVGPLVDDARRALGGRVGSAGVPDADASGWLVAADPAACIASRSRRGLRTILVGPGAPGRRPVARPCDVEARTFLDAVLEILAADAMPSRPGPAHAGG